MGVERAVTRWYLQRQQINNEIAILEVKLEQAYAGGQGAAGNAERIDIEKQLASLQTKLRTLGPCPRPMMG